MTDTLNYIIYMIVCKDASVKEIYVGKTSNFKSREYNHRYLYNKGFNSPLYSNIRLHGGFNNWEFIKLINCDSQSAPYYECKFIKQLSTLNKNIPTRDGKQWYQDNKEIHLSKIKKYHSAIKERLQNKFMCVCGGKYTYANKSIHNKSKKHINYINNI